MKTKYELEYTFNTSPNFLYTRLSTPEGLSEWFADNVNLKRGKFQFIWEGAEQEATVIQKKTNKFIRFHWEDDEDQELYFEFRIHTDELTGDVALLITDFAEEDEKDDAIDLWNSQISELKHGIGL
ncbi:MAG: SRPBCC domain-containing protein [Bacteroidetes bacterium]|nr:MAG: SRPBCC domain-containing protein [Bacteroidota bacterium]RLD72835.1 MAG: SRPBCC domain-containing protein [Bacteroidota bacterium]RLD95646.1 MAG: SRPBCC domain-containing protein [Bacteroidota bacterium]